MTTTIMKDSQVGDAWIRQVAQSNPTAMIPGMEGMISSGPVRLAFCDPLFTPRTALNNASGTPKFGTMALYTPFADLNVFYAEYYRLCGQVFPELYVASTGQYPALTSPFHDQGTKLQYRGFTPGLTFINHTSKFQPRIVDVNKNDIVDQKRVYPGVWAVLVLNGYAYGKNPPQPKKGIAFGLQAVMIIGDDTLLAGGGVDPREAFKGVGVVPPTVNPATMASLIPGAPPPKDMPLRPPGMTFAPTPGAPPPMPPRPPAAPDDSDVSSLY
jgi:Protein of unknown function (DUF2815)